MKANEKMVLCGVGRREVIIVYRKYKDYHRINSQSIEEKRCKECLEWFIMDENNFGRDRGNKDSFNMMCKGCQTLKNHEHYIDNREDLLKKSNEYRANNLEQVRQYDRERYQRDKIHRNATSRKWRIKHKDYVSEHAKEWRGTKHGKSITRIHSRFRQQNKMHEISNKEWISCKNYFKNEQGEWCCAYCGMTERKHKELLNQQLHKDHADPDGSNGLSNCIPSCRSCNSNKWKFNLEEWYKNNLNFTQERYDKILKWLNGDYKLYMK